MLPHYRFVCLYDNDRDRCFIGVLFLAASLIKGIGYMMGIIASEILITYFSKKDTPYSGLSVGKTWGISFVRFIIGFLLLEPYRIYFGHLASHGSATNIQLFIKITPVWALITFLFIQFHLNRSLKYELMQLQEINAGLEKKQAQAADESRGYETLDFVLPGTPALDSGRIAFINVIEHYSYIHYWQEGVLKKREIKMPLKDIISVLPDSLFMQIHRSYIVNISHITRFEKSGRSYDLFLKGIDTPVLVSRYRISEVLPRLAPFLDKAL